MERRSFWESQLELSEKHSQSLGETKSRRTELYRGGTGHEENV